MEAEWNEHAGRRAVALAEAPIDALIPSRRTNYHRWVNFSWHVIEPAGQLRAGEWTAAERARLEALVGHAHSRGLWIRFYTLNGHAPAQHREWSASYNFGSFGAAEHRWRAAIAAGVDLIATDQYEELAAMLSLLR